MQGAASFTIYNRTKEYCWDHNYLCRDNMLDVALTGGLGGAMSGALISFGSARECPVFPSDLADLKVNQAFELVKVDNINCNIEKLN